MELTRIYEHRCKAGQYVLTIEHTPIRYIGTERECRNLQPLFERDAKRMYLKELKRIGIVPVDVVGGRMWHKECTGAYAWDLGDLVPWIPAETAELLNRIFTYQLID